MITYNVVHDNFGGMQNRNVGAYHYGGGPWMMNERYYGGYMRHGGMTPLRRPRYENGNGYPCCSCGFWADPTC